MVKNGFALKNKRTIFLFLEKMKSYYYIIVLAVFAIIIGYLLGKLNDKRRQDIIKLLIKRDKLPDPAEGTKWMQGGACYMSDGAVGTTKGNYCELIQPV